MKSLLIATAGILAAFATLPATAGVLIPEVFAREYCAMRSGGVSNKDSVDWAVERSYLASGIAVEVTLEDGRKVDADIVAAGKAAETLCPNYYLGS